MHKTLNTRRTNTAPTAIPTMTPVELLDDGVEGGAELDEGGGEERRVSGVGGVFPVDGDAGGGGEVDGVSGEGVDGGGAEGEGGGGGEVMLVAGGEVGAGEAPGDGVVDIGGEKTDRQIDKENFFRCQLCVSLS